MADDRSLAAIATGERAKAFVALAVVVALVATGDLSTPVLAVAVCLGALAAAAVLAPAVREYWAFHVLLGVGVALYGVAFGLTESSLGGRAFAAFVVVLGLLVVANHLGIVPWSDHPRRI